MNRCYALGCALTTILLSIGGTTLAQTQLQQLEINGETRPFQNRVLQSGAVSVSVSYEPWTAEQATDENYQNLRYQISYNGRPSITGGAVTLYVGSVTLQDVDGDRTPEVIFSTYSGGAHCCTNTLVYSWGGDRFRQAETGMLDGNGGRFEDLDQDGRLEFVTVDNAFLYAFSSYAGSYPPSLIYQLHNGKFEVVTRRYPQHLRRTLQQMFQTIRTNRNDSEINGVLAGYVAQKILLGEYQQGWQFMLANYDRQATVGLTRYNQNGQSIGQYANFPEALRYFLIRNGYLDAQGRPRP